MPFAPRRQQSLALNMRSFWPILALAGVALAQGNDTTQAFERKPSPSSAPANIDSPPPSTKVDVATDVPAEFNGKQSPPPTDAYPVPAPTKTPPKPPPPPPPPSPSTCKATTVEVTITEPAKPPVTVTAPAEKPVTITVSAEPVTVTTTCTETITELSTTTTTNTEVVLPVFYLVKCSVYNKMLRLFWCSGKTDQRLDYDHYGNKPWYYYDCCK